MGDSERIDVEIEYFIEDVDGNVIHYHADTRAVMTKLGFVENFDLPSDIEPGRYIFYVKVNYAGNVASASEWFSVIEKSFPMERSITREVIILILSLVIIVVLVVVIFLIMGRKKKGKKRNH